MSMRTISIRRQPAMLLLLLVLSSIPPNFCQFALASSPYISNPFSSSETSASLGKGFKVRDTRSKILFTKYDLKPAASSSSSKFNTSSIESEIAAIFKEFAYGSSTSASASNSPSKIIFSSTTTPLHTYGIESSSLPQYFQHGRTEPEVFIGKQREVHAGIRVTSDQSIPEVPKSTSDSSIPFTYNINREREKLENNTLKLNKERSRPVIESYPSSFDLEKENLKKVQVHVTTAIKKNGYEAIQLEIGRAWAFHVYLTGISFGVVAAVCLLSLSRISTCSQLLPRGYFITLHLMVFLASFLRCLSFLHDPYGAYGRLPTVLTSLLFNSVDPCLTTAYSVLILVLLRAARIRLLPLNIQSPLVLATLCGIHIGGSVVIDVSSGVLEDKQVIANLNITTQAVTATWGAILCVAYVISFTGIEKAAHRQQGDLARLTLHRKPSCENTLNTNCSKPPLIYAARLFLICTLLHGLLIAFIILNLVKTNMPLSATASESWAWWTQTSLERIIEIALCALLLATALVLTHSKLRNLPKDKEEKIFSILSNCGKGTKDLKNMDVYPVANDKCNILSDGTLHHTSLNRSINLSKNGWKHMNEPSSHQSSLKNQMVLNSIDSDFKKGIQRDCPYNSSVLFSPLQVVHNGSAMKPTRNLTREAHYSNFFNEAEQNFAPSELRCYSHLNNHSRTIPRNNYYCSQRSHPEKRQREQTMLKANTIRGNLYPKASVCDHVQFAVFNPTSQNVQQHAHSHINYNQNKSENEYEVAPYYSHSNASSSTHVYTKPYSSYSPSTNAHQEANLHPSIQHHICQPSSYIRSCDLELPKSENSVCSSSQSEIHVDYLTDASSSNDGLSSNTLSRSLTLPLYNQTCSSTIKDKARAEGATNPDHTPDSAVGLDYSSQVEGDLTTPENFNSKSCEVSKENSARVLQNLSNTPRNDVLRHPTGFGGNGGNCNMNYARFSLEGVKAENSTDYSGGPKSISTENLDDLETDSPSTNTKPPKNLSEALNRIAGPYTFGAQPISSI